MKKKFIIIFTSASLVCFLLVFALIRSNIDFIRQFQSFTVTIHNESDYDIVSIETGTIESNSTDTGIIEGSSKDVSSKTIKSGDKLKIKPKLSLRGEGGIYLKYTDSRGETVKKGVCSYTESLSGYSTVTIKNEKTTVEEKCM